ncbi:ExbD/TolR family protein [Mariprofundus ferrooxydans]|uniref:ExbD/TolR family protein n=1 Tax=Mariprofundus ferrooxydans TaxID=314344 RepID=UPI0006A744A3|nr:biopolymer transporter ExbD [Mariprofundus ferrooxydans]KON48001.1 hypothetical protein AL013_04405 [Mariprofundus ferrooxydans]
MQFEGMRRSGQAPNLTPLIDIVFLLLVFFLLTSHFVKDERIDIDLPQASSSDTPGDDKVLEITLSADNRIYLQGNQVTEQRLPMLLREKLVLQKNKQIRLRGDQGANLKHIVTIMDAARQAGASGIDLVTEQP